MISRYLSWLLIVLVPLACSCDRGDGLAEEAFIKITNSKYDNNCFWGGPKGLDYGLLHNAQGIQQPALYPDQASTYFVAQFELPEDASLTITGEYPHERYFSFTVANNLGDGGLGGGNFLLDQDIDADEGSTNPFKPGSNRYATPRNYTIRVVNGADKEEPNTLYTGTPPNSYVHLAMRNYVADRGFDGTGVATLKQLNVDGLPKVTYNPPGGGTPVTDPTEVCQAVGAHKNAEPGGYPAKEWRDLVDISLNPVYAPAKSTPVWELFWDIPYSVTGLFIPDQERRVEKFPPDNSGGFANNPNTNYLTGIFSLSFGQVYIIQGKMPTYVKTRDNVKTWPAQEPQVRYWSVCSGAAPPSGAGWDCVYDEQVPLDRDGYYTIVVSLPEDRPLYAKEACGVKWLSFGRGETRPGPELHLQPGNVPRVGVWQGARSWVNFVYMRFMNPNPNWEQSPAKVPAPTPQNPQPQEAEIMGDYFPVSRYYQTSEDYDKNGCIAPPRP